MSASNDLNYQNLMPVQNGNQPKPVTLASAAIVAPVGFLTLVTGTTAIATVTPPIEGAHILCFIFTTTTPVAFTTSGNIKAVATPTQNVPVVLVYEPIGGKYYAA